MARDIDLKTRGVKRRQQKKVYLIITEGKNKTETLYFSHYKKQGTDYAITFVKAGSNTDAESLYKTVYQKWRKDGFNYKSGDRAFIVMDIDNDKRKADKVIALIKENKNPGIVFIVSNPTFEIWFLLHYKYTTKSYTSGKAVISDLRKAIPKYDKTIDVYPVLEEKVEKALINSRKLEKFFEGKNWPDSECNPRTDVGDIVELLF